MLRPLLVLLVLPFLASLPPASHAESAPLCEARLRTASEVFGTYFTFVGHGSAEVAALAFDSSNSSGLACNADVAHVCVASRAAGSSSWTDEVVSCKTKQK